jgi:hypothetical protein
LPSRALDWEKFDSLEEALKRAEELVLPDERYKIEAVTGVCATCAPLHPHIAEAHRPQKPNKKAANG